jgi:sodium-dependent dicarboxylate transporter 2/3/5
MTPATDPPILRLARPAGPLGCLALHLAGLGAASPEAWTMGGVLWWVALWWMTEAMPVGATSLLPALLLPALGILDSATVASTYMDRFILLMMAGFMSSLAIERTGLHRRMALFTLFHIGASPRRLVLGLLIATAAISAWIANTAATLIMLPVGLALIERLGGGSAPAAKAFGTAACLAIAYGASIGGMATPLGTPTNLLYFGAVERATGQAPGFLTWVIDALPIVIGLVAAAGLILGRGLPSAAGGDGEARAILLAERAALGPLRREERHVAAIFGLMILAWVTREAALSDGTRVGWAPLLGLGKYVDDATVAVGGALVLFAWPARALEGGRLLTWDAARRIPWEVVLLFGGGLALARGFDRSGLDAAAAEILSGLEGLPSLVIIAVVALLVTFLTEVTSNTAVATLLMPILAAVGAATGLPPETTMLPAAISASCAFMLPVATPPNAVVYGMGHVTIGQMARSGLALNLAGVAIITAWLWLRHGV